MHKNIELTLIEQLNWASKERKGILRKPTRACESNKMRHFLIGFLGCLCPIPG